MLSKQDVAELLPESKSLLHTELVSARRAWREESNGPAGQAMLYAVMPLGPLPQRRHPAEDSRG